MMNSNTTHTVIFLEWLKKWKKNSIIYKNCTKNNWLIMMSWKNNLMNLKRKIKNSFFIWSFKVKLQDQATLEIWRFKDFKIKSENWSLRWIRVKIKNKWRPNRFMKKFPIWIQRISNFYNSYKSKKINKFPKFQAILFKI